MDKKYDATGMRLTEHLTGAYDALKSRKDIAHRRMPQISNCANDVHRIENGTKRRLQACSVTESDNFQILESNAKIPGFDPGFIAPICGRKRINASVSTFHGENKFLLSPIRLQHLLKIKVLPNVKSRFRAIGPLFLARLRCLSGVLGHVAQRLAQPPDFGGI